MGRANAQARQRARRKREEERRNRPASNEWRKRMGMKPITPSGRKPKATTAAEGTYVNQNPRSEAAADHRTASTKTNTPNKPTPTKPTSTKTSTKSTVKSPTRTKANDRLSATLSGKRGLAASARQPKNAGAGNGAPGAQSSGPKKPHIKSKRLRDALKSVKKYKPKK